MVILAKALVYILYLSVSYSWLGNVNEGLSCKDPFVLGSAYFYHFFRSVDSALTCLNMHPNMSKFPDVSSGSKDFIMRGLEHDCDKIGQ